MEERSNVLRVPFREHKLLLDPWRQLGWIVIS